MKSSRQWSHSHTCFTSPRTRLRPNCVSKFRILLAVSIYNRTGNKYCSYTLIDKIYWSNGEIDSYILTHTQGVDHPNKRQRLYRKGFHQGTYPAIKNQGHMPLVGLHKRTAVSLCRGIISGRGPPAIWEWLTLSSNYANKHVDSIKKRQSAVSSARALYHWRLLRESQQRNVQFQVWLASSKGLLPKTSEPRVRCRTKQESLKRFLMKLALISTAPCQIAKRIAMMGLMKTLVSKLPIY